MFKIILVYCVVLFSLIGKTAISADLGKGVMAFQDKDYETALVELIPLANKGVFRAQNVLYIMYLNGFGVKKDVKEGEKWMRMGAESGNSTAQYIYGQLYIGGEYVKQDLSKAHKWLLRSAQQGEQMGYDYLYYMYLGGYGVQKNVTTALKLFLLQDLLGGVASEKRLKEMYDQITQSQRKEAEDFVESCKLQKFKNCLTEIEIGK